MFASPFPDRVGFACVDGSALRTDVALPEELAALRAGAHPQRTRDFALGRIAAHRSMAAIGAPVAPVLAHADRSPIWPAGLVGSITHAGGLAAAAVARASDCEGLGVDIERLGRPRWQELVRRIADEHERDWIADDEARFIAVFSAKESVYKAFRPLAGRTFGFGAVTLSAAEGGFEARLLEALGERWPAGSRVPVRCERRDEHTLTAVMLGAAPA